MELVLISNCVDFYNEQRLRGDINSLQPTTMLSHRLEKVGVPGSSAGQTTLSTLSQNVMDALSLYAVMVFRKKESTAA